MSASSNLIKKISNFYKIATNSYLETLGQGYHMPDEPEVGNEDDFNSNLGLYSKIIDAANRISNSDIAAEVLLIAELYKKALQISGGYNYVNKSVSNIVNLLDDEDDHEQSSVEDLMNEISRDLRTRAKSTPMGDDDSAINIIKQTKNDINSKLISEDLENSDEPSAFEAGLTQYEENAKGVHDPSGGVSGEVAATKGRGYRVERRNYKDWIQSYEDERQRYIHDLSAPEIQLSRTGIEARKNTATRSNLEDLIKLLGQLIDLTKKANELEVQLQTVNNPEIESTLNKVQEMIKVLQKRRGELKLGIKNYQNSKYIKDLENELNESTSNQEKFVIQQKIELQKLMMSGDKGKDEEAKWRKVLIKSMSGGNSLPADQLLKIQEKIKEGAAKKIRVNDLYKQKAEQIAKLKGTTKLKEKEKGHGKSNAYQWEDINLDGLTQHLTERLATERVVVKQKVTDKMKKAQQDPAGLKPFMDDVAKAATKKDKTALLAAAQRLKQKMIEFKNVQPEVVQYVISLRASKFFYNFRDKIKLISNWIKENNTLSPEQMEIVNDAIREGNKLIEFYRNMKIKTITPGWSERSTYYKPPTEIIERIVKNLEGLKQ